MNGWIRGVHDPSAALFLDGRLIVCVEEERFTRSKHAFDALPYLAIAACLHHAGIDASRIGRVAVGWDLRETVRYSTAIESQLTDDVLLDLYLPRARFPERRRPAVHLLPHHEAHAIGAFAGSGFDDAAVVVMDGSGEYDSTTILHCRKGHRPETVVRLPFSESLGIFYQALTAYLGFGAFQEGKAMGLAAHGEPRYTIERELDLGAVPTPRDARNRPDEQRWISEWMTLFEHLTGQGPFVPRHCFEPAIGTTVPRLEISPIQRDLAASAQAWLEEQVSKLARQAVASTGSEHVVLCGGVAMNCPANYRVLTLPGVRDVYVPPAPGDAGASVGAGAAAILEAGGDVMVSDEHAWFGVGFEPDVIRRELDRTGLDSWSLCDSPEAAVAERIGAGDIVAVFQGRGEFGPRALGGRSILADPRSIAVRDRVNAIKQREPWRPLAPAIRAEAMNRFFEQDLHSPFMSFSVPVREEVRASIAGVVHADGSARVQTVHAARSPFLARVIDCFERQSGIPLVLNTSFNVGPEPIVSSPRDALRTFLSSGIDLLVIDRFVVRKPNR